MPATVKGRAMKVLHLDLRSFDSFHACEAAIVNAAEARFNHVCAGPVFDLGPGGDPLLAFDHRRPISTLARAGTPEDLVKALRQACEKAGLALFVDIVLGRIALGGGAEKALAGLYDRLPGRNPLDPRLSRHEATSAVLRGGVEKAAAEWWAGRLTELVKAGAQGFRLLGLADLPPRALGAFLDRVREKTACAFWAWTPGLPWSRHDELATAGLSAVFASTCWWDGRAAWYVEEHEALRRIAPILGVAAAPFEPPAADPSASGHALTLAALTADGLFTTHQSGGDREALRRAAGLSDEMARKGATGGLRALTSPAEPVTVLLRTDGDDVRTAQRGVLLVVNTDPAGAQPLPFDPAVLPSAAGRALGAKDASAAGESAALKPGEIRSMDVTAKPVVRSGKKSGKREANAAAAQSPVVIERVSPSVNGGAFAAKHIAGRPLVVEADIFADGHDLLAAEVLWWSADDEERRIARLAPAANDRWRATLTPDRVGRHYFSVEAWRDEYGSLAHGLEVKHRAGIDVTVELAEAATYLAALERKPEIAALLAKLEGLAPGDAVTLLTSSATRATVAAAAERRFRTDEGPFPLEVERPQAEFASWYELFPRSLTDDANRHGTFDDVIAALPRVRAMGFDVLYFPPIHPIGKVNRKGRNNSLTAGPDDVGSPYAIGGEGGGHDAIHRQLGSPEDFRRLVVAARGQGLEIALDFAIQCSLDHPWLREHPDWFRRRPDGTIKYAENPPKKYEDIVNVDFYAKDAVPSLWLALRDVVLHWVDEGVRIFRVDNPHTKPLPFWEWMIGDVRGRHPDVMFLSEAFTRPKMMYRLAKVGFSQSYTYFTWRNGKQEIADYLRELSTTEVANYFRPHFFVNTPDINPVFLQTSGRAGFLIRAALAATLSGLWGVYSGFELCEAAALPGKEEYLDSEKYEIRPRDFAAPGNIVAEITMLNRLRRSNPALQSHLGVTFYNAGNERILVYGKRVPGARDMVLVAVSLDPHHPQETGFEIPLWEWKLPDDGTLDVEDLVRGERFAWHGKNQHLRLDPAALPFAIWRLSPRRAP
ncbi:alpha-1,4-glucan--maltose-1-phosphate maltosyltransferase [uncultured Reyranella sp.]|uniref:alpha-1,4-glucan--maltose-1-phosphate maltosyltransferase n=1 Tax=uncultured Reyranella sp. TaxID=735512 RepID=UPI00259CC8B0|nr:alpha-1,4-glucan--maltose-1-phosphate maltosyltransferase [uncultured Reyranella sp.]